MPVEQLTPRDLRAALDAGEDLVILDVRTAGELRQASLPGVVHIPLDDLPRRHRELDPDSRVVCLCHHGIRSMHAALLLESRGFDDVANLVGGIDRYSVEVDTGVPRY